MPLVAGVDSSTSACKVEVRDADSGALVAAGRSPHAPTTPPRSEQHPDEWWAAFRAAAGDAGVFDRNRPAAIAVAGQQHGLVVLGEDREVLRPAKLWNDTESAPDSDDLVARFGREAWIEACGSVPVPSFTITKLQWLRRCEPDVYRAVRSVLLPHDWLTMQLTGSSTTDRGDASGTGWWSPADESYRPDLLALVDPDRALVDLLPEVLGPSDVAGEWPEAGAVVGPGTGDNMAAALGLGLRPGDLALSLGTSGTAFEVRTDPASDPTGTVAGFADASGGFLPLVCTLNAMKVLDAVGRLLGVDSVELDRLVLAGEPGAGGLVLVPHFDGERTPNRPRATGVLTGLRSDVTREQLARAAAEAVVCSLLDAADFLPRPADDGRVLLVGGGARRAGVRQVVADLLDRDVVAVVDDEVVARGAAVQAAAVLSSTDTSQVASRWGHGAADVCSPTGAVDAAAVREQYRAAVGC